MPTVEQADRRLLLVHWPAADWRWLTPLIDDGVLPTLARLREGGASAALSTVNPQTDALQATAIATGVTVAKHRVLYPLQAISDGQMRPTTAADREAPALWTHLDAAGLPTAVVGWAGTGLAEDLSHGVMISDAALASEGTGEAPEPAAPGFIRPLSEVEDIEDLRLRSVDLPPGIVTDMIPHVARVSHTNGAPAFLMRHLARNTTAHLVATDLIRRRPWRFMAVEYDLLSRLAPAFVPFHPPCADYVHPEAFETYRWVMTRAAGLLDSMLATLLEEAGPGTTVMLVSAHGLKLGDRRPMVPPNTMRATSGVLRTERGLLLMHGPGVTPKADVFAPSALDVAPTALALMGQPVAQGLAGRVLQETFEGVSVTTGPAFAGPPQTVPAGAAEGDVVRARLLALLAEDGFGGNGGDAAQGAVTPVQRVAYAEALALLEGGAPREALPKLEAHLAAFPDDRRARLHLSRCLALLGALMRHGPSRSHCRAATTRSRAWS